MKMNKRVTGTEEIERETDTSRTGVINRNSFIIEFDQLVPLLLRLPNFN